MSAWLQTHSLLLTYVVGGFGPVALVFLIRSIWRASASEESMRELRIKRGECPKCGYDVRASGRRCPECGTVVKSQRAE